MPWADEPGMHLKVRRDPYTGEDLGRFAFLYVGAGGFHPSVPMRHLTAEEADEIGRDLIRALRDPHTGRAMYYEQSLEKPKPRKRKKVTGGS